MKRKFLAAFLSLGLLLNGCAWVGNNYVSVTPHQAKDTGTQTDNLTAHKYIELQNILSDLVENGTESAVIYLPDYAADLVDNHMTLAIRHITEVLPIGAYAIDHVDYELGTSAGQQAISVNIAYLHGRAEIRQIRQVTDMDAAKSLIQKALADCSDSLIFYAEEFTDADLVQLVADYSAEHPDVVMEIPQLSVGLYPEKGEARVVELKFTYQTSRDTLRTMQTQVKRVFASAALYINQNDAPQQKFSQLYAFLTERFDYKYDTSITPSYSLLSHGVGDAKAFATVYAAMCRSAGLDCRVVSGTRSGEAWYWNLVALEDGFFHVDLLESQKAGQLSYLLDEQMTGYVWDYSAHPAAVAPEVPETTE